VISFTCPRCGSTVEDRFYGPCPSCRDALRAALVGAAREVEVEAYEPKVNVTPNAVALKE
jgi:NMD protein affecting ribosome stability and mRNA decay